MISSGSCAVVQRAEERGTWRFAKFPQIIAMMPKGVFKPLKMA